MIADKEYFKGNEIDEIRVIDRHDVGIRRTLTYEVRLKKTGITSVDSIFFTRVGDSFIPQE